MHGWQGASPLTSRVEHTHPILLTGHVGVHGLHGGFANHLESNLTHAESRMTMILAESQYNYSYPPSLHNKSKVFVVSYMYNEKPPQSIQPKDRTSETPLLVHPNVIRSILSFVVRWRCHLSFPPSLFPNQHRLICFFPNHPSPHGQPPAGRG